MIAHNAVHVRGPVAVDTSRMPSILDPQEQADFSAESWDEYILRIRSVLGEFKMSTDSSYQHRQVVSSAFGRCRLSRISAAPSVISLHPNTGFGGAHGTLRVWLQLSGESQVEQGDFVDTMWASSLLIYDPAMAMVVSSKQDTDHVVLNIPKVLLPRHVRQQIKRPLLFMSQMAGMPAMLQAFIRTASEQCHAIDSISRSRLERTFLCLVIDLLASCCEESAPDESRSLATLRARVMSYMEAHLDEPLTAQQIAQKMRCSPRYIYQAFDHHGTTPGRYLLSVRLDRAYQQLVSTGDERTISQVAHGCGFNSYSHFARAFKSRFGVIPTDVCIWS